MQSATSLATEQADQERSASSVIQRAAARRSDWIRPLGVPRQVKPYVSYTIGHDIPAFTLGGLHASVLTPAVLIVAACLALGRVLPK